MAQHVFTVLLLYVLIETHCQITVQLQVHRHVCVRAIAVVLLSAVTIPDMRVQATAKEGEAAFDQSQYCACINDQRTKACTTKLNCMRMMFH